MGAILNSGLKTPLGYIPGGTMNDWASNLGIPSDMVKAAEVIVEGKPVSFDIGKFNKKHNFSIFLLYVLHSPLMNSDYLFIQAYFFTVNLPVHMMVSKEPSLKCKLFSSLLKIVSQNIL